ncbi:MAG: twin-arginine translocation signal domain-containing protein [Alcanivorax sp.]|nr:twin-arginine translocation signal domain-containing protein [Alcanivorax sp.]
MLQRLPRRAFLKALAASAGSCISTAILLPSKFTPPVAPSHA